MNTNKETRRDDQETDRNEPILVPNTGYNNQLGVVHPEETATMNEEDMLMQRDRNEQCAIGQNANIRAPENSSEETQSSNFSFGIKDNLVSITSISVSVQTGQSTHQNAMQIVTTNTDAHLHNVVNEQISRISAVSKQVSQQGHKDIAGNNEQITDTNQQGETSRMQQGNNRVLMEYQSNFPKISNNYARYDSNTLRNQKGENQVNNNVPQNNGKQPYSQQQANNTTHIQDSDKTETSCSQQDQQQVFPRRHYKFAENKRQAQGKNQPTSQQQESTPHLYNQQEQEMGNLEEHWQIQKRKQNRNQEQANPKTMWRPV
ncbi:hypothetical protein R3W88_033997 [Solanum pinnatisectum]|uniref:Uncharacterized protein n=1 Tax=Solanum pinnatisectum TaxID=50273 RepID=A0AAV9JZH2_9SOLN|nr:hypothetical protein R3W88_033997 [Solanum pinnatisectum]